MIADIACLHAQLGAFHHTVNAAHVCVERALSQGGTWYVALSGGKDSTCVLALVRAIDPACPAIYFDDEWELPETTAYLHDVPNLMRIKTRTKHCDWFTGNKDMIDAPVSGAAWAAEHGYTGCFLGLRMDENTHRRLYLKKHGTCHFAYGVGVWQCNPIANWSVRDVWAYIHANGLLYNRAYDQLVRIGVPLEAQRIGPFANARALGYGQLAILRRGWPDLYNAFAAAHPEARGDV